MHESSNWSQQTKGIYSTRVTWLTRDTTEIWIAYVNPHVACELVLKELSLIPFISAKGLHFPALVWPFTVRYNVVCAPPGAHYDDNVGWFETSKERINHEKQFSFSTEQSDLHKQLGSRLFGSFLFLWAPVDFRIRRVKSQCDVWSPWRVQKGDILSLISAILLI